MDIDFNLTLLFTLSGILLGIGVYILFQLEKIYSSLLNHSNEINILFKLIQLSNVVMESKFTDEPIDKDKVKKILDELEKRAKIQK